MSVVDEKARVKALKNKIKDLTGVRRLYKPSKVTIKGEPFLRFLNSIDGIVWLDRFYVNEYDKVFKVKDGELVLLG